MTNLREAAQQALEALENHVRKRTFACEIRIINAAIALRAALDEVPADFTDQHKALPLYTSPPQRQPLTDEQIVNWVESGEYNVVTNDWASHIEFVRAIEAAHGISGEQK